MINNISFKGEIRRTPAGGQTSVNHLSHKADKGQAEKILRLINGNDPIDVIKFTEIKQKPQGILSRFTMNWDGFIRSSKESVSITKRALNGSVETVKIQLNNQSDNHTKQIIEDIYNVLQAKLPKGKI